jgi:transcription elongation factor Elf1
MGRKKYVDTIVKCIICGKEYTEILCEKDLPDIVAFYCGECGEEMKKEFEKVKLGIKSRRTRPPKKQ